ncbi:hypothetical protein Tco_0720596 [Tanacetum coccineum]
MQLEKESPNQQAKDCIGKYELMIDENNLEHMFDYLINKEDTPFMKDGKEGGEEKKFDMIGTPSERTEKLDNEFDDWAKEKGFVNTIMRKSVILNEEIKKANVLTLYTSYPSRRYGVSTPALHKKPRRYQDLYVVSRMLIRRIEDKDKEHSILFYSWHPLQGLSNTPYLLTQYGVSG